MSSKPNGLILQACEVFPKELILPLAPINAKAIPEQARGKAPAFWTGKDWALLAHWQMGASDAHRELADEKKGNVGLLTGLPQRGHQYVMLDCDLETDDADPNSTKTRVAIEIVHKWIIPCLQNFLGKPIWVRITKPGRASLIFEIDADQPAGRKAIHHLYHPVYNYLGKLELLASGNQSLIAGKHPVTKEAITWYRTDQADAKLSLPVTEDSIYKFPTRNHFDTAVGIILSDLERASITVKSSKTKSVSEPTLADPEEQAPPSTLRLIELLDEMPHDARIDRETYVSIMHGISGCITALEKLKRLSAEERRGIRKAAIDWACRWEDPKGVGTTEAIEAAKFDNDWSKTNNVLAGWRTLVNTAVALGMEHFRLDESAEAFSGYELEEPVVEAPVYEPLNLPVEPSKQFDEGEYIPSAENGYIPEDALDDPYRPRKRIATDFHIPEADIAIADSLERAIKGRAMYREDLKTWFVWQGTRLNWSMPYGERVMKIWIENSLCAYAAKHFSGMDGSKIAKFMSGGRMDTLEKILRVRMGEEGPGPTNPYILQCPKVAYDLRTAKALEVLQQRDIRETRTTNVTPKNVPTPIFDDIISTVCGHDKETVNWLWHYLGYLLLGNPINHSFLIIHGTGGNGKGALCRAIQKAMGGYTIEASRDLLVESAKNKHKTTLYDLKGKRIWFVSEISPGEEWNEAQIKGLSGGDTIAANKMHHDTVYFKPEGAFVIATNNLPKFHRIDDAILRRLLMISTRTKPEVKDALIEEKLERNGELSGILYKLIQYAAKMYQNGFQLPKTPEAMNRETRRYLMEQDAFFAWFNEECATSNDDDHQMSIRDLKMRYERFVKNNANLTDDDEVFGDIDSLTEKAFVSGIGKQGCKVERKDGQLVVFGIKLKPNKLKAA